MSSNSSRLVLAALAAVSGLGLTACASGLVGQPARPAPRTPTEQYGLRTEDQPDELLLAPHDFGLSPAQRAALAGAAQRWRDTSSSDVVIEASTVGGASAYRTSHAAADVLTASGVPTGSIRIIGYDADPAAPVKVSFLVPEKVALDCGRSWDRLTATRTNGVPENFGCAISANRAAMIADAADIVRPRADGPSDAGRRQNVLDKYRRGEVTSAAKDEQASSTASKAIN